MQIELYGRARRRAEVERIEVEAANLAQALRALAAACPALEPEVVHGGRLNAAYLASLNGEFVTDGETPLRADDTLLILAAQAGG